MNQRNKLVRVILVAFLFLSSLVAEERAEDRALRLQIGDPALRNKLIQVAPGEIISARTGKPIAFSKMIQELEGCRFVYVGESHDNLTMHDIQLQIIQALYERDKSVAIGLEMLPAELQPVLDKWSQGLLAEEELLREVGWYIHWNMNFGYYKKIFALAKEKHIPVYALNAPRSLITKIRMLGWDTLSEEEKRLVPRPDLSSNEHRLLIRTIFESTDLPHQMKGESLDQVFEGLYRAQAAWDEVMATNAVVSSDGGKRKMIILAGSGHLLYNLGINRRVQERTRLPSKTVIVVSVKAGEEFATVARSLGDYIWGIEEEEQAAFPSVGLSFKKFDGLENLVIERKPTDGAALAADFEKGDIVLSVDAKAFTDINELRIYLARFGWGEETKFSLLRSGENREVVLKFNPRTESSLTPEQKHKPAAEKKVETADFSRMKRLERQIQSLIRRADGEVGVAVKHLESGQELYINGETSFPMASVFKIPVLVEVLAQVKERKFSLEDEVSIDKKDQHLGSGLISDLVAPGIKLSVRNLIQLMMMISDNSATDILLKKVGPENVTKRLASFGIEGLTVNRSCQELIMDFLGLDYEKYKSLSLDDITGELEKAADRSREARQKAVTEFSLDERDQSTPRALCLLLEKIFKKEILDAASCDLIISIMLDCQTGESRIKGELPPGSRVAHKTGTIAGTVNDCGIIYLPDGQGHVILAVLTKNFMGKTSDVESTIAKIARFVYDFFYFSQ
ncbi:MAG: class A beta-lactamase [Clostridiales bacterium]|nr:class A beta-lactamase [Clostridiales bacterium]